MTMHDERRKALRDALTAIQRAVVPLGGSSPWNEGFTEARKRALGAVSDLTEIAPAPDDKDVRAACLWALVQFQVKVMERDAADQRNACEANGWRSSSTHDLAADVIDTISRLATGSLDAKAYLAEQDRLQREPERDPDDPACVGVTCTSTSDTVEHQSGCRWGEPETPVLEVNLVDVFHERTGRCLGGNHADCAGIEARHRAHDHSRCIDSDGEEPSSGLPYLRCQSTRPFGEPVQCKVEHGHSGPHREGLGTEVWRDGQTRSIHDRSPREDGRRADWDALSGDQKVKARLDGSEFAPPTLEQRVATLERRIEALSLTARRAIDIASATQDWSPGR